MIQINLLPGKKKKAAGAGFQLRIPDFRALLTQIKDPWLIAAAAAALLCGGMVLYYLYERARLAALDSQLVTATRERKKFDEYITELRRAERLRDSLVAEIGVIRGIDADRYVWPHVLDQISKALPPFTWLVDVFYDNRVKLFISAETPAEQLLAIDQNQAEPQLRALAREFDRTASRLIEMQSRDYLARSR